MNPRSPNTPDEDFRLLGLKPGASPAEVKQAYRELAKKWHPDFFQQERPGDRRTAEERFKDITAAYRRLSRQWKVPTETAVQDDPGRAGAKRRGQTTPRGSAARSRIRGGWLAGLFRSARPSGEKPTAFKTSRAIRIGLGCVLLTASAAWMISRWWPMETRVLRLTGTGSPPVETPSAPIRHPTPHRGDGPESAPVSPSVPEAVPGATAPTTEPGSLSPASPSPREEAPPFFTLGSSREEVLRVQGPPGRIHGQTWVYSLSEVHFKEGHVSRYDNFDGSLKVHLPPSAPPPGQPPRFFSLGSSRNEVLTVQGTPTRVHGNRWYYGFSEIRFKNDHVEGYDNYFGNLYVRLLPSDPLPAGQRRESFTVGATADEVLAVQGTPTSIHGNTWFYELSSVLFREGKVQYVNNVGGNLRYIPPAENSEKDKGSG